MLTTLFLMQASGGRMSCGEPSNLSLDDEDAKLVETDDSERRHGKQLIGETLPGFEP